MIIYEPGTLGLPLVANPEFSNGVEKERTQRSLTILESLVEHAQTPGALAPTFDDLHAELVLCVRPQFVDVSVQVGRVDDAETARRLGVVSHRVVAVVGDALVAAEAGVGPRQEDGGGGKDDRL